MRTAVLALALLISASASAPAQEELLPAGETGVLKRGWVLLNTWRYARGEGEIAVPDGALQGRTVNYVAFYVEGELVAVDEVPPYRVTHDFGSYTRRVRIVAVGVRYELQAGAEPAAESPEPGVGTPAASIAITSPAQGEYCCRRVPRLRGRPGTADLPLLARGAAPAGRPADRHLRQHEPPRQDEPSDRLRPALPRISAAGAGHGGGGSLQR